MADSDSRAQAATARQKRLMWRLTGLAFMMSSEVAAGAGIGWLIDNWLGTANRWLTIGGIAGIAVGMTSFIRGALQLSRSPGIFDPNAARRATRDARRDDDDHDDHATRN